jgi:hypothetical protein
LAGDLRALYDCIAYVTVDARHAPRKLHRNAGDELACSTSVAAASGEEEARTEMPLCSI